MMIKVYIKYASAALFQMSNKTFNGITLPFFMASFSNLGGRYTRPCGNN